MCAALLAAGADVRAADDKRGTALHYSAEGQQQKLGGGPVLTAAVLLAAGADPNAADSQQRTPLHVAIWEQRGDVASLLLLAGADANAVAAKAMRWVDLVSTEVAWCICKRP